MRHKVPCGERGLGLTVDLVQNAPEYVRAHQVVLRHLRAAVALSEARQVDQRHEAAQLRQLRNDLAPMESADQGGGEQHHALPGLVLRSNDAVVHANAMEG